MTTRRQQWVSFSLGLWLAVSPWLAGYAEHEVATANAAAVGLALALVSHFEVSMEQYAFEWLILAAGVWLLAAPFLLAFGHVGVAAANCVAVGACVTALAARGLSLDKAHKPLDRS